MGKPLMPALVQTRTLPLSAIDFRYGSKGDLAAAFAMSGLPLKADIRRLGCNVRYSARGAAHQQAGPR